MSNHDYRVAPLAEGPAETPADGADDTDPSSWIEPPEWRSVQVAEALHGQRIDKALVALAPEFSRSRVPSGP